MVNLLAWFLQEFVIGNWRVFLINIIQAVIFLIAGILIGILIKFILKKLIEKANLQKIVRQSFIELFVSIIKWSIYILFLSLALKQLEIPELTNWLTSILTIIPALVGALLLIAAGFAIAVYLRDLIEESNILYYKVLSIIVFYFVLYVFCIFALKTALISLDKNIVNIIVIILTGLTFAGIVYWHARQK